MSNASFNAKSTTGVPTLQIHNYWPILTWFWWCHANQGRFIVISISSTRTRPESCWLLSRCMQFHLMDSTCTNRIRIRIRCQLISHHKICIVSVSVSVSASARTRLCQKLGYNLEIHKRNAEHFKVINKFTMALRHRGGSPAERKPENNSNSNNSDSD